MANKTETVCAPRELLEQILSGCMFTLSGKQYEELRALLAAPADDAVVYRYQHEGAPGQWFYTRDPRYYSAEPVTLAQLLAALPKDGSLEAPAEYVRAMVDEPVAWQLDVEGYKTVTIEDRERALSEERHYQCRGRAVSVHPLYRHAQRKVVMPERIAVPDADCPERINAQGWNACLDNFERLNGDQS